MNQESQVVQSLTSSSVQVHPTHTSESYQGLAPQNKHLLHTDPMCDDGVPGVPGVPGVILIYRCAVQSTEGLVFAAAWAEIGRFAPRLELQG